MYVTLTKHVNSTLKMLQWSIQGILNDQIVDLNKIW